MEVNVFVTVTVFAFALWLAGKANRQRHNIKMANANAFLVFRVCHLSSLSYIGVEPCYHSDNEDDSKQ